MDNPGKKKLHEHIILRLTLLPGGVYSVLDFGCGTGDFLGLVSEKVSERSNLCGIDAAEPFINAASKKYPNVSFIYKKFDGKIDLPDASFDVVVTVDVLECIADKKALVDEFHRILKPGGKVLAAHWDWDTMLYNAESKDIARRAVAAFSDWKQPWMDYCDGQMGRKLWGLFEGSGKFRGKFDSFNLIETAYRAGTYGFDRMQDIAKLPEGVTIGNAEYEKLAAELIEKDEKNEYFFSVTSFLYSGEKL